MNTPAPYQTDSHSFDPLEQKTRATQISVADQRAFESATLRLRNALLDATEGRLNDDIADARLGLRSLAVKLRDAGFWRSDKHGLRATVSLLWEADRFLNDQALTRPDSTPAQERKAQI